MENYKHERTKYDVPLSHLDYDYVDKCSDVKELEKIVKVLRQGQEGKYPLLEERAEEKLAKLSPNSRVLRKDKPIGSLHDLDQEERERVTEDLDSWFSNMKNKDEVLKQEGLGQDSDSKLPPVRGSGAKIQVNEKSSSKSNNKENKPSAKRVQPRDYREWDKIDVEAELAKVDGGPMPETKEKKRSNVLKTPSAPNIPDKVDVSGLTEEEKLMKADREKDKGNEAFRSTDYNEALLYYSRSINLIPTIAAQNNRAQCHIKLKQWDSAIADCNAVLKTQRQNLKALLRRGVAYQGKGEFIKAGGDIKKVLDNEPNNKRAADILKEIEKSLAEQKAKGKRMVIEEVDGSDSDSDSDSLSNVQVADDTQSKPMVNGVDEKLKQKVVELTQGKDGDRTSKVSVIESKKEKSYAVIEESKRDEDLPSDKSPPPVNSEPSVDPKSKPVDVKTEESAKPAPEAPKSVAQLDLPSEVSKLKDSGNGLFRNGQYAEAIGIYDQALTKLPDNPGYTTNKSVLFSNRAACKSKIGDCEGCVKDCNFALELVPASIKPMMRRAQAYETMEKYRKAYVDYRQVLLMDISVEMASQGAARCTKILQQMDGARWREKLPAMPSITPQQLYASRPVPQASQPQSAKPSVNSQDKPKQTSADSKPKHEKPNSSSHANIKAEPVATKEELFAKFKTEGNDLVKKGQFEAAVDAYSKCTECCPDEVASYTNRALCYLKLNKPAEVIDDCDTAITLDSENVKALFRRAQAHRLMKNYDESIRDLKRLLSLDRNNMAAKKDFEAVLRLKQQQLLEKKPDVLKRNQGQAKAPEKPRQRIQIEEIEGSSDEDEKPVSKPTPTPPKIEEVKISEQPQGKKSKRRKNKGKKDQAKPTAEQEAASTFSSGVSSAKSTSSKIKPTAMDYSSKDVPKLSKSSPFEFMHAWMSIKATDTVDPYCKLLEQIKPEELPTVISNKLEGDMLISLAKCCDQMIERGEVDLGFSYLQHLTRVPRFQVLSMFLSDKEKRDIMLVFDRFQAKGTICPNALKKLKKEYGL